MPKLTSGLTQKERLEVLQSIDLIKAAKNTHEQKVLQLYRDLIAREYHGVGMHIPIN